MYLIASATEMELEQIRTIQGFHHELEFLVTGVGPVESAIRLTAYLEKTRADGVLLFGVGGAYSNCGIGILDICLAETEHFGDLGIAHHDHIEYFSDEFLRNQRYCFDLRNNLYRHASDLLQVIGLPFRKGHFVTVQACSGTGTRGAFLRDRFHAICENMEGASLARVCSEYTTDLLEIRCISNIVENRDPKKWRIEEAVESGARVIKKLIPALLSGNSEKVKYRNFRPRKY